MTIDTARPVICGPQNYARAATVAASTEAADHPASAVTVMDHSRTWRSTAITATNLDFDLGSLKSDIAVLVLGGTNLSPSATVAVKIDDDPAFGSPSYSLSAQPALPTDATVPAPGVDDTPPWGLPVVVLVGSEKAGSHVRFTLADPGSADGYIEVSYAMIGPGLQLGGESVAWETQPLNWVGGAGPSGAAYRGASLTVHHATAEERRRVLSLARALRGLGRVFILPHPAWPATWLENSFLAQLSAPPQEVALPGRVWEIILPFREVGD